MRVSETTRQSIDYGEPISWVHLGGYASNIEAGASKPSTTFYAGNIHAQLCSFDGRNITTWTSTNHDKILQNHTLLIGSLPA